MKAEDTRQATTDREEPGWNLGRALFGAEMDTTAYMRTKAETRQNNVSRVFHEPPDAETCSVVWEDGGV